MATTNIAIIGGGNLGTAIANGLLQSAFCDAAAITITKRNTTTLAHLQHKGVHVTADNVAAVSNSHIIIIAVKPFQIKEILQEIQPVLTPQHLLISVVTGVSIADINEMVTQPIAIVRAMPNTAIAIQQSITCITTQHTTTEQNEWVIHLFNQLGKTVLIEEKLMNAATVLGACGTAFAMRYIRANIQGGIEIGFDAATASLIAAQTVKGAAELLLTTQTHPEQEIDKVTTPKGCTIAGLNEMEHQGFSSSMIKGIAASFHKIG